MFPSSNPARTDLPKNIIHKNYKNLAVVLVNEYDLEGVIENEMTDRIINKLQNEYPTYALDRQILHC